MVSVVDVACELIRRPSVSPNDGGCCEYLAGLFADAGFKIQHLNFNDTKNLWVTHGEGAPLVAFNGHCDVVPPGPVESWLSDPFTPTIEGDTLRGRGASDMKGPLAAIVVALLDFVYRNPNHAGTVGLLVTSDEEGMALDGTGRALQVLLDEGVKIDYCVVGEPTSEAEFGDMLKVGRRGSVSGKLTAFGKQGHVAYPHLADNPIHKAIPFLNELTSIVWDLGNENFPPTTLQISNIHGGSGAVNVIPGSVTVDFNLRYNTELTAEEIEQRITHMAEGFGLKCEIAWNASAKPFVTRDRKLIDAVVNSVEKNTGNRPIEGTGGGTSDARFLALHKIPVIEFGPSNATIHAVNECVSIRDLESCVDIYRDIVQHLL